MIKRKYHLLLNLYKKISFSHYSPADKWFQWPLRCATFFKHEIVFHQPTKNLIARDSNLAEAQPANSVMSFWSSDLCLCAQVAFHCVFSFAVITSAQWLNSHWQSSFWWCHFGEEKANWNKARAVYSRSIVKLAAIQLRFFRGEDEIRPEEEAEKIALIVVEQKANKYSI